MRRPVGHSGALSVWRISADVLAAVREELAAATPRVNDTSLLPDVSAVEGVPVRSLPSRGGEGYEATGAQPARKPSKKKARPEALQPLQPLQQVCPPSATASQAQTLQQPPLQRGLGVATGWGVPPHSMSVPLQYSQQDTLLCVHPAPHAQQFAQLQQLQMLHQWHNLQLQPHLLPAVGLSPGLLHRQVMHMQQQLVASLQHAPPLQTQLAPQLAPLGVGESSRVMASAN